MAWKLWRNLLSKPKPKKVINFLDLGSGAEFERASNIATRKHLSKRRVVEAVDVVPSAGRIPLGLIYTQKDALKRMKELASEGTTVKVINGDSFFSEQMIYATNRGHLRGRARCDAAIASPIMPNLLEEIKRVLPKNGRLYSTAVKWHCEALAEKLKQAGFEVRFRPLTHKEGISGPPTTNAYYYMWNNGEFSEWFGKKGWELQRMVAIKRK